MGLALTTGVRSSLYRHSCSMLSCKARTCAARKVTHFDGCFPPLEEPGGMPGREIGLGLEAHCIHAFLPQSSVSHHQRRPKLHSSRYLLFQVTIFKCGNWRMLHGCTSCVPRCSSTQLSTSMDSMGLNAHSMPLAQGQAQQYHCCMATERLRPKDKHDSTIAAWQQNAFGPRTSTSVPCTAWQQNAFGPRTNMTVPSLHGNRTPLAQGQAHQYRAPHGNRTPLAQGQT